MKQHIDALELEELLSTIFKATLTLDAERFK